ncbi:hypothetical protein BDN71DRAFT_1432076 [Pleurotus eryngii]|uniref:Ribonuclease H1 N-terminal domain-containing protein n=1 Tax=Pleurotus eryngii TaxID=5323 RepID=A0A9P5ZX79_PLEER|nr:hypothetical protein BDN71DRAFT_1432076 [Pleurotus eryngii]
MLSQLDASLVMTLPPGLSALATAQPAATTTQAPVAIAAAQPAVAPATAAPVTPAATATVQPAPTMTMPVAPAAFAAIFRCPNCNTIHFMAPVANSSPALNSSPAPSPPPTPNPGSMPTTPTNIGGSTSTLSPTTTAALSCATSSLAASISQAPSCSASSSTAPAANMANANFIPPPNTTGSCWYSVMFGCQVGVYQDWFGIVEPLVNSVPGWKCKSFSIFAAANNHFNAHSTAGLVRVYVDA